jgi:GT2 family glycosyltransferase
VIVSDHPITGSPDRPIPPTPHVSIVIVTWNGRPLLERFLPSVLATDYPAFEVVVADNASTDGTPEWLAQAHPSVRVIRHPENWLFARGNNAAVAQTAGELICLLNNDVEVQPDWLRPLVDSLVGDPEVAAVQPKLLQHSDRRRFEYAGAAGGFLDSYAYPFARGRLFSTLEEDTGQYDDARDVSWATGACMLVRRDAWDAAGGLDERFGMHMEEIDLCWRLWRAGWRVRVQPASHAWHLGGASLPHGDPRKTRLNFRNSLLMLYKNSRASDWPRLRRARRLLDGLAAARMLVGGDRAGAAAVRQAWREFGALAPHYAGARPAEDERCAMPMYGGSVVVDYFLRGRRRFDEMPARWEADNR